MQYVYCCIQFFSLKFAELPVYVEKCIHQNYEVVSPYVTDIV